MYSWGAYSGSDTYYFETVAHLSIKEIKTPDLMEFACVGRDRQHIKNNERYGMPNSDKH